MIRTYCKKINLFLLFSIIVLLLNCNKETHQQIPNTSTQSNSNYTTDSIALNVLAKSEDSIISTDVQWGEENSSITFDQKFTLKKPDTALLHRQIKDNEWNESLSFLYLKEYYKETKPKKAINYYSNDIEKEDRRLCAFTQEFQPNIKYQLESCNEVGIEERVEFPKVNTKDMRNFINLLYHNEWNEWTSESTYEPDGAGCYYEIQQKENKTILLIYCGC